VFSRRSRTATARMAWWLDARVEDDAALESWRAGVGQCGGRARRWQQRGMTGRLARLALERFMRATGCSVRGITSFPGDVN
jgi:hypothetical protein